MHRIHFTAADIARIRLLPTLGPMAETLFSLQTLRGRSNQALFGGWRQHVRGAMQPRFGLLGAVSPTRKPHLDLTTLSGTGRNLAQSGEGLLARSRHAVRLELDHYANYHGQLPGALQPLADDLEARRDLITTLNAYHQAAIGPRWTRIRSHLDAERTQRGMALLDGGVDDLLATLHPNITWTAPTLHIQTDAHSDADFSLDGQGLILVPSFFLREPEIMVDPATPEDCLLIYPARLSIEHAADVWTTGDPTRALANLLGRTRALILTAIGDGITTTGTLAHQAGTSDSAVSQHTATLREAGLITTRRHRSAVHHALTQTGISLLNRRTAGI